MIEKINSYNTTNTITKTSGPAKEDSKIKDKNFAPNNEIETSEKKEEKLSLYSKIMRNLALANMRLRNRTNSANTLINNQNDLLMQQQIAQQMHQQAMQDHFTAVQMTTPGMGII